MIDFRFCMIGFFFPDRLHQFFIAAHHWYIAVASIALVHIAYQLMLLRSQIAYLLSIQAFDTEELGLNPVIFEMYSRRCIFSRMCNKRVMKGKFPVDRLAALGQLSQNTNTVALGQQSTALNHLHSSFSPHKGAIHAAIIAHPPAT